MLVAVGLTLGPLLAPASAQVRASETLGETLEEVGGDYAQLYAQPIVDIVGANLNSGFFHTAGTEDRLIPGVNLYLGIKSFGTPIGDDERSLSLDYAAPESITLSDGTRCTSRGDVRYDIEGAPTAFGSENPGAVSAAGLFDCNDGSTIDSTATLDLLPGLPSISDLSNAPLAVPQAGFGIEATGTHLSLRYLPRLRYRDYGALQFIGGGLRQDIGRFLPEGMPLDLSVFGFYQSISVTEEADYEEENEVVSASAVAAGLSASKQVSLFTFYGGAQLERTSATLQYTYQAGGDLGAQSLNLEMEGNNTFRALAGVSAALGPVVLNVDFSQGQRSVLSAALGFSL